VAREKNPLCPECLKEIDLAELSMIELSEALEGSYIHPECRKETTVDEG
jgi:hypothetical protein